MNDEKHRQLCLDVFQYYQKGALETEYHLLSENSISKSLLIPTWENYIYVLRLGNNASKAPSIAAIPNALDHLQILYIGGHESGQNKGRALSMVDSALGVQRFYHGNKYAINDNKHGHSVANQLTTSLLNAGFRIEDCIVDVIRCGEAFGFDEFELLVGYQETFHHLPPWNAKRGGALGYKS